MIGDDVTRLAACIWAADCVTQAPIHACPRQTHTRCLQRFPSWQILLVDLRCHGETARLDTSPRDGPHSVASAADDVLRLLRNLRLFPNMLIGHSFGGKVVMSMVQRFGGGGAGLPRPVQVCVSVWAGGLGGRFTVMATVHTMRRGALGVSSQTTLIA